MNNKGFGLQELLVFIGIFVFCLVVIVIYWNATIGNDSFYDEPDVQVKQEEIEDTESTKLEVPTEYMRLENKLKNAAKNYPIDKKENVIITLKQLQSSNLIDKIVAPNNQECNGYVVYTVSNDKYIPYINCEGMYTTDSYDHVLEN